MSDNINNEKYVWITAKESMVKKVSGMISPGDTFLVSHDKDDVLIEDKLCLISFNERQWVERYTEELSEYYKNIYPIMRIVWRS